MELSYYDVEHHATAHLMDLEAGRWYLTELQVGRRFRGQGHAGRLLERVLADADQEGATLCLSLDPDGTPNALERDALQSFYERRGFVLIEEGAMVRAPTGTARDVTTLRGAIGV